MFRGYPQRTWKVHVECFGVNATCLEDQQLIWRVLAAYLKELVAGFRGNCSMFGNLVPEKRPQG